MSSTPTIVKDELVQQLDDFSRNLLRARDEILRRATETSSPGRADTGAASSRSLASPTYCARP